MNINELRGFTIYVTNDCNLRCKHCWVSGGKSADYLDYELIISRILEAYDMGVRNFLITGGEPFMHPQIIDIIECIAKKEGAYVDIETNATLIGDCDIERMEKYKNISLFASIDSSTASTHDSIRGINGAFDITKRTVEKLVKHGLLYQCIMAVSKLNEADVENTIQLCIQLGVKILRVLPVQPCGRGEELAQNRITFDVKERIKFYEQQQKLMEKYKGQILIKTPIPPAFMKLKNVLNYRNECSFCNRLTLLPNGRYSMCGIGEAHPNYQFGENYLTTVFDCWNNNPTVQKLSNETKKYKSPCQLCIYKNICKGFCHAISIQDSINMDEQYRFCYEAYKEGLFPSNALVHSAKEIKNENE